MFKRMKAIGYKESIEKIEFQKKMATTMRDLFEKQKKMKSPEEKDDSVSKMVVSAIHNSENLKNFQKIKNSLTFRVNESLKGTKDFDMSTFGMNESAVRRSHIFIQKLKTKQLSSQKFLMIENRNSRCSLLKMRADSALKNTFYDGSGEIGNKRCESDSRENFLSLQKIPRAHVFAHSKKQQIERKRFVTLENANSLLNLLPPLVKNYQLSNS